MNINPDQLAQAVMETLEEYVGVTEEAVAGSIIRVSERTASNLRSVTPPNKAPVYRSWHDYLADWATTKLSVNKKGVYSVAVHNKKHYQLTHLLENGHALHQGGSARAFPHIAPIAEKAEEELFAEIKRSIQ